MAEGDPQPASELRDGVDLDTGKSAELTLDDPICEEQQAAADGSEALYELAAGGADEPCCDPPPKLIAQFDPRWSKLILHSKTTWGSSGCHPTTVATVLRWIVEDNPATRGKLKFPAKDGTTLKEGFYAQRMCEAFWPELGGKVQSKGGKVAHDALMNKAEEVLGMSPGSALLSTAGDRLATVKKALKRGPVVVNMTNPGHFVIIQGFRGGRLHIIDGGRELDRFWKDKGQKIPIGVSRPTSGSLWDSLRPCYVSLDASARYDYVDGDGKVREPNLRFLDTVIRMESFYFAKIGA